MQSKIIRFCYRKIIGIEAQSAWDKFVFEDSYREFLLQAQFYDQDKKHVSFAALLRNVPGSEKLHHRVSASVVGYLSQLNGVMPDIRDNLGRLFLSFNNWHFEIVNSDRKQKQAHQVAINFFSDPLQWLDTVGSYLLLAPENVKGRPDGITTNQLMLQPFLSICSIKNMQDAQALRSKNIPGRPKRD